MGTSKLPVERFAFLEMLAFWQGNVRNSDLVNQFSITRQQAYKDFRHYQEIHPGQIVESDAGGYLFAASSPSYFDGALEEYMLWLQSGRFNRGSCKDSAIAFGLPFLGRKVCRRIVSALVLAVRNQMRVEVDYVSLSNPKRDGRIFSPHSFVKAGTRWHVRGYCEQSGGYRDLVLSRF